VRLGQKGPVGGGGIPKLSKIISQELRGAVRVTSRGKNSPGEGGGKDEKSMGPGLLKLSRAPLLKVRGCLRKVRKGGEGAAITSDPASGSSGKGGARNGEKERRKEWGSSRSISKFHLPLKFQQSKKKKPGGGM